MRFYWTDIAGSVWVERLGNSPRFITVGGLSSNTRLIMTRFKVDRFQHLSFQKAIDKIIYAYAFGEAVGTMYVGGLCIMKLCDDPGHSGAAFRAVNNYYSSQNAYQSGSLKRVTIGGSGGVVTFRGLLESMSLIADGSNAAYGSFALGFKIIDSDYLEA